MPAVNRLGDGGLIESMIENQTNHNNPVDKPLWFIDLGRFKYMPVWEFQKQLQQMRIANEIPDVLIFVEHPPVYTIGKNGTENHIIAPSQQLAKEGIEVIPVDRGGDVTYHGPGQLVGYPIFDLKQHRKSVSYFMRQLEEVFIQALKKWHIEAGRNEGYTGVWVGNDKIVALGVRISRWVTMHGFAFNVEPNLAHFNGIIPCGIFHLGVTSLRELLGHSVGLDNVKTPVLDAFQKCFGFSQIRQIEIDRENLSQAPAAEARRLAELQNQPNFTEQENIS